MPTTPAPSRRRCAASAALIAVALLSGFGCAAGESDRGAAPPSTAAATPTPAPESPETPVPTDGAELRAELLAMAERDQAGRTGGSDPEGDRTRTQRLREIIDAVGWPTITLVGDDGADAAWLIAQHSDLDPDFQAEALELLTDAAADGEASLGNVAYLEDRVLVARGDPQTYGTQIGCGPSGPEPATPIADPDQVDERRSAAGLAPLADYYAELVEICAAEG